MRVVPAAAVGHLFRGQAEQEEVLLARFLRHLDRGAVARADGQRAVHHELHVAGAAGFVAGGRDLVGDIAGWDQPLGQRDAVFGQEHHFEPAAHRRIAVDRAGKIVDELDDELGQLIGRRRFAGEEERPRRHLEAGILAQPVIEHDDAQRIQQLPLVFVDALDLAIEDRVRIDRSARRSL